MGILASLNPITGELVKGMTSKDMLLNYEIFQISHLSQMNNHFLRPLIIMDKKLKVSKFHAQ